MGIDLVVDKTVFFMVKGVGLSRTSFSLNLVVPSLTKHPAIRYVFIFTFILLLAGAESVIQAAFNEWEQKTCIRFRKRTTERNYVEFFKGSG